MGLAVSQGSLNIIPGNPEVGESYGRDVYLARA